MADAGPHPTIHPTDRLLGSAPTIAALRAQIRHLASFDTVGSPHVPTILLQGETGTGKGLVARVLHDSGPRVGGSFIEVNGAAIPDTMLEAELFGFEPGAFTDAKRAKPGLFEAASGGTLFLDEIDALPLGLQGKLLTAIETKRVRRSGAVVEQAVDVKLIAATNAVLPEVVAAGRFRADLYHRLAVVVLGLPPLRERGEDIRGLAAALLQHYTAAHGVPAKRLSAEAETWLQGYAWPGNVRELSHVMERVTLLHMGEEIDAETLVRLCQPLTATTVGAKSEPAHHEVTAERALPTEAEEIRQALVQTGGNVVRAARLLGVSRDTVRYRMQRYGIVRPRLGGPPPVVPPPLLPGVGAGESSPQDEERRPEPRTPLTPLLVEATQDNESAARPDARDEAGIEPDIPPPGPAWEQKPVAVLALELTWPEASGLESVRYDPWTEGARWEQAIRDKVYGFGGLLVERTASRLVWVFGVPQTLEQLPQRAVHSALAIRQMIVDASAPNLPPCPAVRLAVHLGAVQVDQQAADRAAQVQPVGETLALPVRLIAQATPGELLITPEVGRLVDGWVALEERSWPLHADDATHIEGYAVVGVNPGREAWAGPRRPNRSPFVGREREVMLLDALLDQVQAGRGQVVSLVGAPGMGKSRLLDEFRQRLNERLIQCAAGHCLAYGSGIPYLPILDLLRDYCGISLEDDAATHFTQVCARLQQAGLDPDASLPHLLHLLGLPVDSDPLSHLSAETRKVRTFEIVRQLFLMSSQHQPLVLAVENLHWIDPTSEALLASLVDGLAGASILLLATFRPGYRPDWLDKSYATQIALQPLGLNDSRLVARRVMRGTALPPALEEQLLTKAEGNPFFLEELAYTIRDHGEKSPALAVPDTIQAVLAARMDRLPTVERQLLQTAAVLGTTIAVPLLQAIAERPEAALQQGLAHLQAAEFLYETRFFPEREFTFKHALTHEVAYGSLLPERRRALHARIVEALEALARERGGEPIDRLAHHALRGEAWTKALAYCRKAGEQAMARSAYREAAGFIEQAIGALSHLPEEPDTYGQAIDLRLALRSALTPSGHLGRIQSCLREAEVLAETFNDAHRLGQVLCFLSFNFYLMGAYDQSEAAAARTLALATTRADAILQALANEHLGIAYHARGDYRRALDYLRQAVASLEGTRRREHFGRPAPPAIVSLAYLASCHAELGTFYDGTGLAEEGLEIAEAVDHPASLIWATWGLGLLALRQGDVSRALPLLERTLRICQGVDIPNYFPWTAMALGAAYAMSGRATEAVPLLEQALEQVKVTDLLVYQASCHLALGEVQMLIGNLEAGLTYGERALTLAHEHRERSLEAYALHLLGNIATRRNPSQTTQAETHYRQALALADALGMCPLQAHCHRALGLLYGTTGQKAQARTELLAAIALYRTMEMTFWLPTTETALVQVEGQDE